MNRQYVQEDVNGYRYNSEFKPDYVKNGNRYHGYKTNNEEAIFYQFAVQLYDLRFEYEGVVYYFLSDEESVTRTDSSMKKTIETYEDGNDVIKKFTINGVSLLDLINDLKNVEPL